MITENRAKALHALRTADESLRCSGTLIYKSGSGFKMCALGVMAVGMGIMRPDDYLPGGHDWYADIAKALDDMPSTLYRYNDMRKRSYEAVTEGEYKYTWPEIADLLEQRWSDRGPDAI